MVMLTTPAEQMRPFPPNYSPVSGTETTTATCICEKAEKEVKRVASLDGRMTTPMKARYRSVKVGLKDVILLHSGLSDNKWKC